MPGRLGSEDSRRGATESLEVYNETGGLATSKYLVLFENRRPAMGRMRQDLPGCIATGRTIEETRNRMTKAIEIDVA